VRAKHWTELAATFVQMTFYFVVMALFFQGSCASGAHDLADPKEAIQEQLSSMMSAANENLAKAEDHHKKAIEKAREQVTFDLGDASRAVEQETGEYAGDLVKAWTDLSATVNMSKAGLAKEEANPISPGDWSGPGFAERAKLGAQIGATERLLKRAERQRTRKVKEADEKAEAIFEDETQKLGWKLGDLSSLSDEVKQSLEAEVEEIQTNFTRNVTAGKKTVEKAKKDDEQGRLVALERTLDAASKKFDSDQDAAVKKVNMFLAKVSKDAAAKAASIVKDVDNAQHVELGKAFGDRAPKVTSASKVAAK